MKNLEIVYCKPINKRVETCLAIVFCIGFIMGVGFGYWVWG